VEVVTLALGLLVASLLVGVPPLRTALVPFAATTLVAATLIHRSAWGESHPSIRASLS
jgi:hypothetical protein